MRGKTKRVLIIVGLVAVVPIAWFSYTFILPEARFFRMMEKDMAVGRKYMDSLTEQDFRVWADRTDKYLSASNSAENSIGAWPVPPELKQLGIIRIDQRPNCVSYVWMGGLDHTELDVEKMDNGAFQFNAGYNDYSNKLLFVLPPDGVTTNKLANQ